MFGNNVRFTVHEFMGGIRARPPETPGSCRSGSTRRTGPRQAECSGQAVSVTKFALQFGGGVNWS